MTRLVQLNHLLNGRRVGIVHGEKLFLLNGTTSIFALAQAAASQNSTLEKLIAAHPATGEINYDSVYLGESDWRLLPAFDHPQEPARCLVAGTGLTHKKSAENRQAMHAGEKTAVTDSMKMYQWGVEGGRPGEGCIGAQPEWFYKGNGTILRAHGQPLDIPDFAGDGGEEAEVVGAYIIDEGGNPRRVGLVLGNEFSDHVMEQKNYLWLAPSKLRACSIGPELIVNPDFEDVPGTIKIKRDSKIIWTRKFRTGEKNMSHTVSNLEHHHFKYATHRRPGDAHIYFFGADAFSFGEGVALRDGDWMEIELAGFGRPLRNPVRMEATAQRPLKIPSL